MMQADTTHADGPPAKKRRVTRACDNCRRRRIRCKAFPDAALDAPCVICTEAGTSEQCTYARPLRKRGPQAGKAKSLEDKCATLERLLGYLATVIPDLETYVSDFASRLTGSDDTGASASAGEHYQRLYADSHMQDTLDGILPTGSLERAAVATTAKATLDSAAAQIETTEPAGDGDSAFNFFPSTLLDPENPPGAGVDFSHAGASADAVMLDGASLPPAPPDVLAGVPSMPFALSALADVAVPGPTLTSPPPPHPYPARPDAHREQPQHPDLPLGAVEIPAVPPPPPTWSATEPFQAFLAYADDLGPVAEPSTILDFGSWDQSDLLFSLGLVGAPAPPAPPAPGPAPVPAADPSLGIVGSWNDGLRPALPADPSPSSAPVSQPLDSVPVSARGEPAGATGGYEQVRTATQPEQPGAMRYATQAPPGVPPAVAPSECKVHRVDLAAADPSKTAAAAAAAAAAPPAGPAAHPNPFAALDGALGGGGGGGFDTPAGTDLLARWLDRGAFAFVAGEGEAGGGGGEVGPGGGEGSAGLGLGADVGAGASERGVT